ncbi:hypothetical protein [Desulfosediminicola flagellatus]|uniref:hypothetical protein n=1 Tax=Desulfosediminicola flagellatus TaxID=2569541 RepID=UPI0010AD16E5|nr:hypothetical protein [Desulfosediminicola flagellatus]
MIEEKEDRPSPPEFSPYVFPAILAVMGLWCFYDGWITNDPEMLEHLTFNRVGSVVLLLWAIIDFIRTRRFEQAEKAELASKSDKDNT